MDNATYAVKKGGVVVLLSECPDIYEPMEFIKFFDKGCKSAMEEALREKFTIPADVAFKEVECGGKATFVMVTLAENAEMVGKANMTPATNIEEALKIAYSKCGTTNPKITIMPQGANTLPILSSES